MQFNVLDAETSMLARHNDKFEANVKDRLPVDDFKSWLSRRAASVLKSMSDKTKGRKSK